MFFAMTSDCSIRPYRPTDLARLQEITADTFGPVSIDRNMEQRLGAFGQGDWRTRKIAAIAEDCRVPVSWRKSECRRALKIESYGWLIGAMMGKTLEESIEGNVEV